MILDEEIKDFKRYLEKNNASVSQDYTIFSYVMQRYYYMEGEEIEKIASTVIDQTTDGQNDGGIDFIYFDDDEQKVYLCQSKYTETLDNNSLIEELGKMSNTVTSFSNNQTSGYNEKVRRVLQDALDRLSDQDANNVEYVFFVANDMNKESAYAKIESIQDAAYSKDMVTIYTLEDIENKIEEVKSNYRTIPEDKIIIDKPHNSLKYESNEYFGLLVNVSSKSILSLFNKYSTTGLFDLNIRRYIKNELVDKGINETLDKDRDDFWFLNNGIIIACKSYRDDGDTIKLYGFSIVNGGQTTNLIGKYKGKNTNEFFIPCKIIAPKDTKAGEGFFNRIAEATNSQKPIQPRDLKSNMPEMKNLKKNLSRYNIELEIKRGENPTIKKPTYKLRNDELGQAILSIALQRPGTSRSGKKSVFNNNDIYNRLFKVNYFKDERRTDFLKSVIELNCKYDDELIEKVQNSGSGLDPLELNILGNGKQVIFALLGLLYSCVNGDIDMKEILGDDSHALVKTHPFTYDRIINWDVDNSETYVKNIIVHIVQALASAYTGDSSIKDLKITSVSNYFKTEAKYYELIIPKIIKHFTRDINEQFDTWKIVFLRNGQTDNQK